MSYPVPNITLDHINQYLYKGNDANNDFKLKLIHKLKEFNSTGAVSNLSTADIDNLAVLRRMINGSVTDTGCGICRANMMYEVGTYVKQRNYFEL